METYTDKEIDDYVNGNLSFLLVKSKDKNYYLDQISKFKIFNNPEILATMKEINFSAFHCFFSKHPELASVDDFYDYGIKNHGYKDALTEESLKSLLIFKEKYDLSENEYNDLLNILGLVFIAHDYLSFLKSPLLLKLQTVRPHINLILLTAKKFKFKTDDDFSNKKIFNFDLTMIYKYRSIIFIILDFIKRPNYKASNTPLNYLCFIVNDIAKKKLVKNNLVDFTIPLLKDLKELFPEEFNEIIKFENSYLLKRIAEGQKLKIIDDMERDKLQLKELTKQRTNPSDSI